MTRHAVAPSAKGGRMRNFQVAQTLSRREEAAQQRVLASDTLPVQRFDYGGKSSQEILERAGVIFERVVPGSPEFQYVKVPRDWERVATDDPRWTNFVDGSGRVRAAIYDNGAVHFPHAFFYAVNITRGDN